jgi:hypothetical protein
MTIYRGLNGVNREIKQQFRGLSGVNREIKEQYRGYGGVNRKVFQNLNPMYGDGSNNATENGYTDLIYVGTPGSNSLYTDQHTYAISGNWYNMRHWDRNTTATKTAIHQMTPVSGTNIVSVSMSTGIWHLLRFYAGSYTTAVYLSGFYLNIGGSYYTLQQCVANGFIEPLVLLGSDQKTGNYYFSNFTNMYTAGATGEGHYPWGGIAFVPKVAISGYKFYTNKSWNSAENVTTVQLTDLGFEFSLVAF